MENGCNRQAGSVSAAHKVTDFIRRGIIEKKYRAGNKLPTETELCQLTSVSRSGVREAMKVLEANHIIEIRRGDGTYLCGPEDISFTNPLTFKLLLRDTSFEELCSFRESIEMAVLRLAMCNSDAEDLRKMREVNARMLALVEDDGDDSYGLYSLDLQFHSLLADSMKNPVMRDFYLMTFDVFGPLILRNYEVGQNGMTGYQTHVAILEALETKDFIQMGHAIKQSVALWGAWMVHASAVELVSKELMILN